MLLNVDIGNSRIGIACMQDYKILQRYSIDHKRSKLPLDEAFKFVADDIKDEKLCETISDIEAVCICSVVPEILKPVVKSCRNILNIEPFIISHELNLGITLDVDFPDKVGNDRICDCAYAASKFDEPILVIDVGTAIVINIVKDKTLLGGAILPGLQTSIRALSSNTSQLSNICLNVPENYVAKNTRDSINLGIISGAAGAINSIAKHTQEEYGQEFKIILTGYSSKFLIPSLDYDYVLDQNLTLNGIEYIYELNK